MRQRRWTAIGFGLALLGSFLFPRFGQGAAAPPSATEEKIDVVADNLNVTERGDVVEARGNVEVRRGATRVKAEEVQVDRGTGEVRAKGKISVDDPEWQLKAESARLNIREETGEINGGELFIESGHLSLSGRRLQKSVGQSYRVEDGFFTTCLCESGSPSWRISADEVNLTKEGGAIVRGGTFYILDVPVFYLPYAYFPVRTERQTGFLFPRIGASSKAGFKYEQPFFWAISKSTDATLGVDIESRARLGLLGEARTVFSRATDAQVNFSYYNEGLRKREGQAIVNRTIADPSIPEDRWSLTGQHRQLTEGSWKSYSDLSLYSDDLFLREIHALAFDFPADRDVRTARYGRSRFGVFRSWGDAHVRADGTFYQDFIQDDEDTLHRSPEVSFWGRRPWGGTPFELGWSVDGVNYIRREGGDGLRLDLRPEVALPLRLLPYLFGTLALAPRQTIYRLHETERSSHRNLTRELVEFRGRLGSSFGRVFEWDGGSLERVKHVIEPEVGYRFIAGARQRNIPTMDGVDRVNRRNVLTFSLDQRLWGRFFQASGAAAADIREMARLGFAVTYDLDRERKGGDTLSDIGAKLRVTPREFMSLGLDMGADPGPWQLSQASATLSLFDPRPITRRVADRDFMRPNQIEIDYHFIRRHALAELAQNANLTALTPERLINQNVLGELGVQGRLHLTDHLLFVYNSNYNTRDSRFSNNRAGLKILSQCECWTLTLTANRRVNPGDTSVRLDFSLLGLGSQQQNPARRP
jgi:LPS-assembly protein